MPTAPTIAIENIGPIVDFEYALAAPGLHVLRGKHGCGKSTILRTVELLTNERTDVRPTKRDGASRGEATVAGKTLRIMKSTREEGTLGVEGLGDLNIAELHTPKLIDAGKRDLHRIRTLVRLAGVKADPSLFHAHFGGKAEFEAVADADAMQTDDLVEMADRVKRAAEKAARTEEDRATAAGASLQAETKRFEGVNLDAPHDSEGLQAAMVAASSAQARLQQQEKDGKAVRERAEKARAALAEAQADSRSMAELQAAIDNAQAAIDEAAEDVNALKSKLALAESRLVGSRAEKTAAMQARDAAVKQEQTLAAWHKDIDAAAGVTVPTIDDLAAAEDAVTAATEAVEQGVRIREAIAAKARADAFAKQHDEHANKARRLRDAGKDTQDVLSDAIARIPKCPLRVATMDDGTVRLVLQTDRSEREPFDDLSDGQKWPHIIALAAASNRLIVLPQAAFGELSESTRAQLHALAQEHGCYILTAQVDDGDLRAELYKPVAELAAAA